MQKPVFAGLRKFFGLFSPLSLLILLLLLIGSVTTILTIDTMNQSKNLEVQAKATTNAHTKVPTATNTSTPSYPYSLMRMFPEAFEAMNNSESSRSCLIQADLTESFKTHDDSEYRTFVSSGGRLTLHLRRKINNQFHDEFFNFTETTSGCLAIEP